MLRTARTCAPEASRDASASSDDQAHDGVALAQLDDVARLERDLAAVVLVERDAPLDRALTAVPLVERRSRSRYRSSPETMFACSPETCSSGSTTSLPDGAP